MICFVDLEHEKVLRDPEKKKDHFCRRAEVQLRLEEISGQACLVQRYTRVTQRRLGEWGIKALLIGGNASDWVEYDGPELKEMYRIIRAAELPILGFCGGCQLIAQAHDVPIGPMRRLREGEPDPYPEYRPGHFKERGFMPVCLLQPDPLFEGLGEKPVLFESHYWELKEPPPGFKVMASTDECRIQAIKHKKYLIYGTQFHPEQYTEEQADGRTLIANFFRLAGISGKIL